MASASCASVAAAEIKRMPTRVPSGAVPETPNELFPFAAAFPAQEVP